MAPFFLLASFSLAFFNICQADLISEVCYRAVNPSLCTQILTSDPRSGGADFQGLGQIAVERSVIATQAAIGVYESNSNAQNKNIIDTCIKTSNDAVDALKNVDFKTGSPHDIKSQATAASRFVGTCDNEFGTSEPPQVNAATTKAKDVISIVIAVANSLP